MAIPLVLDETKLATLRQHAEANPIPLAQMKALAAGRVLPVGYRTGHDCELPVGWRVVYSIEEHPRKDGTDTVWLRHMSMSQAQPGRYPHPVALAEVCKLLGFPAWEQCLVQRNPVDGVLEVLAEFFEAKGGG